MTRQYSIFTFFVLLATLILSPALSISRPEDAPADTDGSVVNLPCDIDSESIPIIQSYGENCLVESGPVLEDVCSYGASTYRSYCHADIRESGADCLSRHHCAPVLERVATTCGDHSCNGGETHASCPSDCTDTSVIVRCGDGICSPGETHATCAVDCRDSGRAAVRCGDGVCGSGESTSTCPADCFSSPAPGASPTTTPPVAMFGGSGVAAESTDSGSSCSLNPLAVFSFSSFSFLALLPLYFLERSRKKK